MKHYDFSGYATRNDIRCSDGRTIRHGAFKGNDGKTVPLVWNHDHKEASNVLGHALLELRDDGMFAYGSFNDTAEGQRAKTLVRHGDIQQMSIYANELRQTSNGDVMHGNIREVSLVLSGANPGAFIETLDIQHSADAEYDEEFTATIYTGMDFDLAHSDDEDKKPPIEEVVTESEEIEHADKSDDEKEEPKMADKKEKTVEDVFNEFNDEQKKVVMYLIQEAVKEAKNGSDDDEDEDDEEDDKPAKHSLDYDTEEDYLMHTNIFEQTRENEMLAHAEEFFAHSDDIFADAKKSGSLKETVLQHAATYGIENIDYLFPDAKTLENPPAFIRNGDAFVTAFMSRVRKSPFARVKTMFADITEDEARAKGYVKGAKKVEEVFKLLKRTTEPTTIYKLQKIDRNDVIDITSFDVVAWMKSEMKIKLDEEVVRAAIVGDGRSSASADKIPETNIRPIWTDDDLYTIKKQIAVPSTADADDIAKMVIHGAVKARKDYKGSGNPILFTTEDLLSDMLLLEDATGRRLYANESELATAMRVSSIVTSELFENLTRTASIGGASKTVTLRGIIVNPTDYNFGADKGGEVSLFDDFDIDYNQYKYLIETRLSGALVRPYSAIAIETYAATAAAS